MHLPQSGPVRLIGVAGPTGSGKTTLAQVLARNYPGALVLSADDYYRDLSHLSVPEREAFNFDDNVDVRVLANRGGAVALLYEGTNPGPNETFALDTTVDEDVFVQIFADTCTDYGLSIAIACP
jgi:cytidylate kinase